MSRINDVGGMIGFPAIIGDPDEPPFHADWEAHVFALNGALIERGIYNLDEFRDAQERLSVEQYLAASYYERWFAAITTLLREKVLPRRPDGMPEERLAGLVTRKRLIGTAAV